LTILNRLGQDSWLISDGRGEHVKDNDVPDWLVLVLRQTFGRLGMIHTRQSRWMYRRVVWNATHRIDGGLSSDRLSSRAPK
jgi:hypothetical protein